MATIEHALSALNDVRGVEGSFFATREGHVLARAMPRIFDEATLSEVGPRLGRLLEALEDLGGSVDGAFVRHPSHAVLLRPAGDGVLFVLTTSEVNVPSLKRGASLVARKIGTLVESGSGLEHEVVDGSFPPGRVSAPPPLPPPPSSLTPAAYAVPVPQARSVPPPVPAPAAAAHPHPSRMPTNVPGMGGGGAHRPVRFRGSKV